MSNNYPEKQNYPSAYDQYNATQNNNYAQSSAAQTGFTSFDQQTGNYAGAATSGGYPHPSYYPVSVAPAGKGMGIASLVLGILALLSGWMLIGGLLGVIGLILGIISLLQAKGTNAPKGLAIWGIVLSSLGIISAVAVGVMLISLWPYVTDMYQQCGLYLQANDSQGYQQCVQSYSDSVTHSSTGRNL